ncbi:TfuA domain protein, core [Leisingera aquaemixtae]|uniref:TfuA-like protein n=1 Tax=Leisingera aquaemixtae TaxID=1396826 RepID=UPI0021A62FB8|nr:TfuA-like protein [Leisingera aquaemixtae]UWQ24381.1 TfuA domain protein, core [Leisingera aquaemixtae]
MTTVVFAGPTIRAEEVQAYFEATVLPPAGQGDIYRAARQGAKAIGLIDGYFKGVPSVWHKEILWALEQGIAVFGSASMGALRAAELSAFGMVGAGSIYEAYASGALIDDDEVAVLHSPAELGFAPLSEPMVSIRATIARAQGEAVLEADQAAAVLNAAKARFYQQRVWDLILADFHTAPWCERFRAWLKSGRVDAKRDDAREMLAVMAAYLKEERGPVPVPPLKVERTLAWQTLVRRIEAEAYLLQAEDRRVLDELRLDPDRYEGVRTRAMLRHLALQEAGKSGRTVKRAALAAQMSAHRKALGLFSSRSLRKWLDDNGLSAADYEGWLGEAALAGTVAGSLNGQLAPHLLAELRQAGVYTRLKSRAASKERYLAAQEQPAKPVTEQERLPLTLWYFEELLQRDVPDRLDDYLEAIGCRSRDEFYELIRREFMYHQGRNTRPVSEGRT